MAKQLEMMYEGKAKQVFATDDPTLAVIHYKDDATAFNGLKKGTIVGKGVVNNLVSNHLFKMLEANGVKTHLVEQLNAAAHDKHHIARNAAGHARGAFQVILLLRLLLPAVQRCAGLGVVVHRVQHINSHLVQLVRRRFDVRLRLAPRKIHRQRAQRRRQR